jgi:1-acyl-sn-glycerol-3-phosphate acyltransferase
VLLVANHPSSLLDPAVLVYFVPRPVYFGAKHTLFTGLFRPILEAFGAIPLVRSQDDPRAMQRNLEAFERYATLLRKGSVAAIFPEGLTHDDPHLAPIKTGAARIALQAEDSADFTLRLTIVPVGLQFEPRRQFRADAFVRFGEPFTISDLAPQYAEAPRLAVQVLTGRIETALKSLAYHVESTEQIPFVERLTDVYFRRARRTGIAGVRGRGVRGELLQKMAACLNHYAEADPESVKDVERALERYERLRERAGIDRRLLEEPSRLLPGPLAPVQATVEVALGLVPALFGFATGAIPYYAAKRIARRLSDRDGNIAALSLRHLQVGAITFPLVYGLESALVWLGFGGTSAIGFAVMLVPAGLFARVGARRMRKLAVHLGGRLATWLKLEAVARVGDAHDHLLEQMDVMRDRYRTEVLGWASLSSSHPRRASTRVAGLG